MPALVIDASAAAELVIGTPLGRRVLARVAHADTLHAPDLLGLEVASVLRRLVMQGEIDVPEARRALHDLAALGIERYEHGPFLHRVFDLHQNLTTYDAIYVVLAEVLGAPLLTCDAKLASVPGHRVAVELIR